MPRADRSLLDRLGEPVERDDDVLADLAAALGLDRERDAVAPAPERATRPALSAPDGERVLAERLQQLPRAARATSSAEPSTSASTRSRSAERHRERRAAAAQRRAVEVLERGDGRPLPSTRASASQPAAVSR